MTTPVQRRQAEQPTPAQSAKAAELIGKVKAALVLEQPFYATILCNLPISEDNSLPTMGTNGEWFKYNSVFITGLTFDELKFVMAHEVLHCVFQHMFRRGDRDPRRWNMAGDYVINDLLVAETDDRGARMFLMPKGGLHDSSLVSQGGGTTEGVYALLPEDGDGPGGDECDPMDECQDSGGSEAERSSKEAEMKVRVAQAAQAAKMCGKLSAGLGRFVDAALKPKVDWKDVLRRFITARAKVDYSFARPKRRFMADDIYLPSLSGEKLGEILVAVDCSGSIGQAIIDAFAAEIRGIVEDTSPSRLHVVYFDSEISHAESYEPGDPLDIRPHGGGGTAFSPIWAYADQHGMDPVCCVVLTDLYCDDFGEQPGYPVLWVTIGAETAPFGEIVKMNQHL